MDQHTLDKVLSEAETRIILQKVLGNQDSWHLVQTEVKPAVDGMAGYLGDHFRLIFNVNISGCVKNIKLFLKTIPLLNESKAQFIDELNIFKKEVFMFDILEEVHAAEGPNPWSTRAYLTNKKVIVMPDLDDVGYTIMPKEPLDLSHVLVTIASIAKFHASFANYETRKSDIFGRPYCVLEEHSNMMNEVSFFDSDWIRSGAKLHVNFLNIFSDKYRNIPNLELKLMKLFREACDSLQTYDGVFNSIIHRDLWSNNIMFKHENKAPVNAILIDFQLIRYAPPAFDVSSLLYLTTSRSFREKYEEEVCKKYYLMFIENIDEKTRSRLNGLNYNFNEFHEWYNKSRLFAIVEAVMIFPYVLMDPKTAKKVYDDPETFEEYLNVDRTVPVVEYARKHTGYRERLLEICEEIVEKYIV